MDSEFIYELRDGRFNCLHRVDHPRVALLGHGYEWREEAPFQGVRFVRRQADCPFLPLRVVVDHRPAIGSASSACANPIELLPRRQEHIAQLVRQLLGVAALSHTPVCVLKARRIAANSGSAGALVPRATGASLRELTACIGQHQHRLAWDLRGRAD
jgi:hypothetical protein